jgi:hypothetical protein
VSGLKSSNGKKLVFVEWQDSYGCSATWQEIDPQQEPEMMLCHSVGWVVKRTKECIVIVPHLSQNDNLARQQGCGDMTIPTAAIVRITPIKVPET